MIARDGATRFEPRVAVRLPQMFADLDAELSAEQIASGKQRAAAWLEAHPQARTRVGSSAPQRMISR